MPEPSATTSPLTLDLPDEAATAALAGRLASLAEAGDVLALRGELGAGKTVFARAFIRARCGAEVEVPSPTFTLVQMYESAPPFRDLIYHFDLFRLGAPEDAVELGIEEAFAEGISLIEWPDRLGSFIPARRLDVTLAYERHGPARRVTLAGDAVWDRRIERLCLA